MLFQDKTEDINKKPNVSESGINKRLRTFDSLLECPKIMECNESKKAIILPPYFEMKQGEEKLTINSFKKSLNSSDLLCYLSRLEISTDKSKISLCTSDQTIPTWSSFNSILSTDSRLNRKVGYFPDFPAPINDASTVYTYLNNFNNILKQFDQKHLIAHCDEGVYKLARKIKFECEAEFENIILALGDFHIIKCLLCCIGKYLKNSGVKRIFIKTNLFGSTLFEKILNGDDYARCIETCTYLSEALRRLQMIEFLTQHRIEENENIIEMIMMLQECIQVNENSESKDIFHNLKDDVKKLLEEFNAFIEEACKKSEVFKYSNNGLILIDLLLHLIRADRTGDFTLHLKVIGKLQAIFHIIDRTNYTRWCAIYLADMLLLKEEYPEDYVQLMIGRFTVKRSNVSCTYVATDQALEQTINRSSKSPGGVEGSTQKKKKECCGMGLDLP